MEKSYAHRPPAGGCGEQGKPETEAFGCNEEDFSTKVHFRAEGAGELFPHLLVGGAVKRQGRGRPNHRPRGIGGDKASSSCQTRPHGRRHSLRDEGCPGFLLEIECTLH